MNINKSELKEIVSDDKLYFDVSMTSLSTFRIGGNADVVVLPSCVDDIINTINYCRVNKISYTIIGNGSNILVSDDGIEGVVIRIDENMNQCEVKDDTIIAEAGALLSKVSNLASDNSLSGLEFASGIPGTIGGAVVMNAGAYDGEMADILVDVTVVDSLGKTQILTVDELDLGYRHSIIEDSDYIVISATLKLQKGDAKEIKSLMDEYKTKRASKQPIGLPSAGSVFKRPKDAFAGALIEEAGLSGYSVGGATVSPKHCGFIVNDNEANASDVVNLIKHIQDTVYKKNKIKLEPEIKFIGKGF